MNNSIRDDSFLLEKIDELKDVLDLVPNPIFIVDTHQRIRYWNLKAEEISGYKQKKIIGKKCDSFFQKPCGPDCGLYCEKNIKPILGKDCKLRTKEGRVLNILKNADILKNKKGEIIGGIESFEDISIQKQTEDHLFSIKKKLEESDKLKSAFLSNMSHEIRTPINSIHGFVQLLKELGDGLSLTKKSQYYDIISKSSLHLIELIDDIVDISKIESNQIKIHKEEFSLTELLDELHTIYDEENERERRNIKLEFDIKDKRKIIYGDSLRIRQVLSNLLNNAFKFTKTGFIKLSYEIIDNSWIQFRIQDTGIGISKKKLEFIFDRFTQIDYDVSRKYPGAGIGLAISKGLVELMGGKIWVESEFNEGSSFFFTLPYLISNSKLEEKDIVEKEKENDYSNKVFLVVEDDESNLVFLEEVLGLLNPKIIHAKDGKQAVEYSLSNPDIDIVIMDIQLPKLNGYEATRQIKKIRPELPIIAQTAFAFSNERQKCLEAGCDDYITKPLNIDLFFTKVKSLLKK